MFITNQAGTFHRVQRQKEWQDDSKTDQRKAFSKQENLLASQSSSFDYCDEVHRHRVIRKMDEHNCDSIQKSAPGSPVNSRVYMVSPPLLAAVMSPRSLLKPSPTLTKRFESSERAGEKKSASQLIPQGNLTISLGKSFNRSFHCIVKKTAEKKEKFLSAEDNPFQRSSSLPELSPIYSSCSHERFFIPADDTKKEENADKKLDEEITAMDSKGEASHKGFSSHLKTDSEEIQTNKVGFDTEELLSCDKLFPIHAFTIFHSTKTSRKVTKDCKKNCVGNDKKVKTNNKSDCFAHGSGLRHAVLQEQAKFYIECPEKKHLMSVTIAIFGPRLLPPRKEVTQAESNVYEVEYWPESVGIHKIYIKCNGKHIEGSPFNVQVESDNSQVWFLAC